MRLIICVALLLLANIYTLAQTPPGNSIVLNGSSQYLDFTTPTGTKQLWEVSGRFTSARIGHATDQVVWDWTGVGILYVKAVSGGTTNLQFIPASGTGTTTVNISAFTSGFIFRFQYYDIGPNMAYILEAWDKRGDLKTTVSSVVTASVSSIDPNNKAVRIGAKLDGTLHFQATMDYWRWHENWTTHYPLAGEFAGQSPYPTFAKNWSPCWLINGNENLIDFQFENDLSNSGSSSVTLTPTGSPTFFANTNTGPTAIGEDLTGVAKGRILLNAARSFDYDSTGLVPTNLSDTLSSNWSCVSAPVSCASLTIREPTRLATWVDGATTTGTYTFTFAVTDGSLTDSDTVTIGVMNLSANMGSDINCFVNEPCVLDATGSAGWDKIEVNTGETIPGSIFKYKQDQPRSVHRYLSAGTYTATVTAYDAQSTPASAADTAIVTVSNRSEANSFNTEDLTNSGNANFISSANCTGDPTGNATKLQAAIDIAKARNTVPQKIIVPFGCRADTNVGIIGKVPVGNEYITIISSGTLPNNHIRIADSNVGQMFTIRATVGNTSAFRTDPSSHHYKFRGIIFESSAQQNAIVTLGDAIAEDSPEEIAHDFIIQQCIARPTNEFSVSISNGILYNADNVSIIDSIVGPNSFSGIESHNTLSYSSSGKHIISNNHLRGASSGLFYGGAASTIRGLAIKDIEIRENVMDRSLTWKNTDPSWDGKVRGIKNNWELKVGSNLVSRGNIIKNNWTDAQQGIAVIIQAGCDAGNWAQANYVDFSYNWLYNVEKGINFRSGEYRGTVQSRKVQFNHNLLENLTSRAYTYIQAWEIRMNHNTALDVADHSAAIDGEMRGPGFIYENGITFNGAFGWFGSGFGQGTAGLNIYFPGFIFRDSLQVGGSSGSYSSPITGMQFPADQNAVGFTNPGAGNWSLSNSSIYKGDANDGTDPGVNWAELQANIKNTASGNWGTVKKCNWHGNCNN